MQLSAVKQDTILEYWLGLHDREAGSSVRTHSSISYRMMKSVDEMNASQLSHARPLITARTLSLVFVQPSSTFWWILCKFLFRDSTWFGVGVSCGAAFARVRALEGRAHHDVTWLRIFRVPPLNIFFASLRAKPPSVCHPFVTNLSIVSPSNLSP